MRQYPKEKLPFGLEVIVFHSWLVTVKVENAQLDLPLLITSLIVLTYALNTFAIC